MVTDREQMLRNIKEVPLRFGYSHLDFASDEFKDDPEIAFAEVKRDGFALRLVSERLRDDPKIVMAAVKNNGRTLEYASERLRDDPEIVMAAVKNKGYVLEYASERLRDNKDIVLTAVIRCPRDIKYASKRLQEDEEVKNSAKLFYPEKKNEKWHAEKKNEKWHGENGVKEDFRRFLAGEISEDTLNCFLVDYCSWLDAPDLTAEDVQKAIKGFSGLMITTQNEMRRCSEVEEKFRKEREEKEKKNNGVEELEDTINGFGE